MKLRFSGLAHLLFLLLAGAFLGTTGPVYGQDCNATVQTVVDQAGETVVFCGTPTEVHASSRANGPIHLNFGGRFPDQVFSVVIFSNAKDADRDALVKRFTSHSVQVSGLVKMYKGKPEIVVQSADDIKVE
jgi:hypothetical protein